MENRQPTAHTLVDTVIVAVAVLVTACQGGSSTGGDAKPAAAPAAVASSAPAAAAPAAAPAAPPPAPAPRSARQEPLTGPPSPTLVVAQAQFVDQTGPDGRTMPVPGAAKLTIVRNVDGAWKTTRARGRRQQRLSQGDARGNGGLLTIGGNQAMLKTWKFANGQWTQETHWNPKFGGKFDRLRDVEHGDLDHDGTEELVIATHDQGVIAIVHPDDELARRGDRPPGQHLRARDRDRRRRRRRQDGVLRDPQQAEQARPGAGGRGHDVQELAAAAGRSRSSTPPATRTRRRSSPPTSTATASASCTSSGRARSRRAAPCVRPVTVKQYRMKDGKWTSSRGRRGSRPPDARDRRRAT